MKVSRGKANCPGSLLNSDGVLWKMRRLCILIKQTGINPSVWFE